MARWPLHQHSGWTNLTFRTLGRLSIEDLLYENPSVGFSQSFRFGGFRWFTDLLLRGNVCIRSAGDFPLLVHRFVIVNQGSRAGNGVDDG